MGRGFEKGADEDRLSGAALFRSRGLRFGVAARARAAPFILILTCPRGSFVRLRLRLRLRFRAFALALARMRNAATGGVAASFVEHITFSLKLPAPTRFGVCACTTVQILMAIDVQSMMNPG